MPPGNFRSLQADKGTQWGRLHRSLGELGMDTFLPPVVDLRPGFYSAGIEVYNQGPIQSCTANALCAAWRYVQSRIDGGFVPSRLFLYYNERLLEGRTNQDIGAFLTDGCRSLATFGVCSEYTWPYFLPQELVQPPPFAYAEGRAHVIHTPAQIPNDNLNNLKDSLVQNKPFVVGIALFDEFMGPEAERTGMVRMPGLGSRLHGFHAVTCVGYNDIEGCWIFRNSWGPGWGDQGHFYLPYEYLTIQDNFATDFWNLATDVLEGLA